ncbi:hypothetical protein [Halomonas sp. IOP_31]|uniref:hypothetical protein n=1 Tax=Halomonas sp. IOP_31 TaxID=2876584 RepID=UPI001E3802DC|nr:hypothetical protein [Halomonas sp. IOP_31]MCD6010057.1 hypothetical protein [Halomonas sp. IOP_31]
MSHIRELSADEETRRLAFVRERALRDEVSFLNDARREEASDNLRSLIKLKFGDMPQWVEARVEQADHDQLTSWMDKILFADSAEELFKR